MIKIAHMLVTIPCIVAALCFCVQGQLSPTLYSKSCPNLANIVRNETRAAITNETRMGASLLRLHFHDCFVQGCDASILLDDTSNFTGEKKAGPNNNSVRGFEVIDVIKAKVESACNGVVSCADILALAARDSVVALGGPSWNVSFGRKDSRTANASAAAAEIPSPVAPLSTLLSMFKAKNLSAQEATALSGAHTIGFARCVVFRVRLYNDTNINATFASSLKRTCPNTTALNDSSLAPLDPTSKLKFDNAYYGNLLSQMGLLHSDQEFFLNGTGSQDTLVSAYNSSTSLFFNDFAAAMVKMGNISPLTGTNGEIRTNCRKVN